MPLVCPKCGGTLVLRHRGYSENDLVAYCENQVNDKCDFEFYVKRDEWDKRQPEIGGYDLELDEG